MKKYQKALMGLVSGLLLFAAVLAQTGGDFAVKQGTIATGGGTSGDTVNNVFAVTGTAGQSVAGTRASGAPYDVSGGIWSRTSAVNVSVAGRLLTANGKGVRNAAVTITDQMNVSRSVRTGSFGYYRFDNVTSGGTYVISILSKRFDFMPRTIIADDELTDVDFIALN